MGGVSPPDLGDNWSLGPAFSIGHTQGELVSVPRQAGLHTPLVGSVLRGGAVWDSHTQATTATAAACAGDSCSRIANRKVSCYSARHHKLPKYSPKRPRVTDNRALVNRIPYYRKLA